MASLYNRATPSQAAILRIIEGAAKNACDAHPALNISPHHRRSIAKRAAGTLTAQWPEVLAVHSPAPSDSDGSDSSMDRRRSSDPGKGVRARLSQANRTAALRQLRRRIFTDMWRIKREEPADYARAMVDVLRMIAGILDRGVSEASPPTPPPQAP